MFVGKQGLNIDGLGAKQIELFLELGWIEDFVSIFHLSRHQEELLTLEGYKEKSVQNLLDAIESARHTTLDRMLVALGIPQVGKKTGKILANFVFTLRSEEESIMEVLERITFEQLESLHDIGPETARSVVEYIEENSLFIERLIHELDIQIPLSDLLVASKNFKLSGKSFCVTGSFDAISRDAIHELIEKNGGEVRTSVSTKLDYLIVGSDAGSKKTKAESLGVNCIGFEEFQEMIS